MNEVSDKDIEAAIRTWDESGTIGILATGPADKRQAWAFDVWPEVFDSRGDTSRCFLWFQKNIDIPRDRLETATTAAKKHDITLQLLCVGKCREETRTPLDIGAGAKASVAEMEEWYPVLHLGSDGMQWPPKKRKRKTPTRT